MCCYLKYFFSLVGWVNLTHSIIFAKNKNHLTDCLSLITWFHNTCLCPTLLHFLSNNNIFLNDYFHNILMLLWCLKVTMYSYGSAASSLEMIRVSEGGAKWRLCMLHPPVVIVIVGSELGSECCFFCPCVLSRFVSPTGLLGVRT
jgi:hypothetical protein